MYEILTENEAIKPGFMFTMIHTLWEEYVHVITIGTTITL